jgi:ribosomal protein S18 acetylase RimI-like enzyme
MIIHIEQVVYVTDEVVASVTCLLPQLTEQRPLNIREAVERIVASPNSFLLIARRTTDRSVVGMLTLIVYAVPSGVHAVIEDVVVDNEVRGLGAGSALIRQALNIADEHGAKHVDLTSSPHRVAANCLYLRLGFARRETNCYRYQLVY